MTAGSTTTFGTGVWSFALPITNRSTLGVYGSARALDSGVAYYVGTAEIGSTLIVVSFGGSATQAQSTVPFTWATGDSLYLTVTYPI
jgi:hypothetical protein